MWWDNKKEVLPQRPPLDWILNPSNRWVWKGCRLERRPAYHPAVVYVKHRPFKADALPIDPPSPLPGRMVEYSHHLYLMINSSIILIILSNGFDSDPYRTAPANPACHRVWI